MVEELKLKDKKLLYNLDFNARMSLTQIAKSIGVSKQVAKYNIEKLAKDKIIQGFYTDINSSKIGQTIYLVYIKFQSISPLKYEEFIKQIEKQEGVGVNTSINGKWDHCIGIWAKTIIHFKKKYIEIMKNYEKFVKEKSVMIETDFHYFKPKQILNEKSEKVIEMGGDIEEYELDEKDKIILSLISKDARISLVDIAHKVKMSANAVKLRLAKLEKDKVILGYRVMINYALLGFMHYRVFLHLDSSTEELEKTITNFLKNQKEVISVTRTIGYCDLEFRAIVKNLQEYYDLIKKLREVFPTQIKDVEFIIYYKFYESLNYFPFVK